MTKIRSVIVEDEAAAREVLKNYLSKYCPQVDVIGEAQNIKEAVPMLHDLQPQLVFLDVEMPFGNAFDVLEACKDLQFETIFVTAFSEYSLKALNQSAAYYLLKPISIEELIVAVTKVHEQILNHEIFNRNKIIVENFRETKPEKRSTSNLPVLYEKYAGHDNNRDFYMLNLKESQNISRQLFVEWIPQIMYNHHQAGPAGSVVAGPPYRDPFNYVFDPLIITGLDAVGAAMQNRLNEENKPGFTSKAGSVFSTWYNGGLRTTTYFHNMIGLLTEIVGSPNPSTIPLVTSRLIPNAATPNPVVPQKWFFRQSIDYSVSLNYAVLNYASRYRDELLMNIYLMGRNAIAKGNTDTWTLSPSKIEEMNRLYQDSLKRRKPTNDSLRNTVNTMPDKFYDSVMHNNAFKDARGYVIPSDQPDFATAVVFFCSELEEKNYP